MDFFDGDVILYVFEAVVPQEISQARTGDFLAFVVKRASSGKLESEYRFRWHNGPGFDAKDEKSFYRLGPLDDTDTNRTKLRDALRGMMDVIGMTNTWCKEVNGDVWALHEAMLEGPLSTSMVRGGEVKSAQA